MHILIIPGLTMPDIAGETLERIAAAAGPDATMTVAESRGEALEAAADGPASWEHRVEYRRAEFELEGLTMGIVGFGGTGKVIARRAAFPAIIGFDAKTG